MEIEVLCRDGKFPPDYLEFYKLHDVVVPKEGSMYTPRTITRNSEGNWEILLVEILNPEVSIKHPILGIAMKEPAWNLKRFCNLDQSEITEEQVKMIKEEEKNQENLVKKDEKVDKKFN